MVENAAQMRQVEPKTRVFISYSRKDMAFADRLEAALKARGFEPLIDRTEIYAFEDWWKRIQTLIGRADTVVFVLSPDAVTSDVALKEVAYAASRNKRFAPIVCRRVADDDPPEPLRRLNYIFFDDPARFEEGADRLAEALQTDIGWVRQHTEIGEAARHWAEAERPGGLLLRSPALEKAESWIASRPRGAPEPTAEAQLFIAASRQGATRRRNMLTGSLAAGLLVALVLAALAFWQRELAKENEARAVASDQATRSQRIENLKSESRLVSVAAHELIDENQPSLAQAIALEGLPNRPGDRPLVDDALKALKRAIRADQSLAVLTLGKEDFLCAGFTPDGKSFVTGTDGGKLVVWDLRTLQPRLQIQAGDSAVTDIDISADGREVLATSDFHLEVWNLTTGEVRLRITPVKKVFARRGQFSPDGKLIAIGFGDNHAEIRDSATGTVLHRLEGPKDFDKAFANRAGGTAKVYGDDMIMKAVEQGRWRMVGGMTDVLFSPDGKILAVAGQGDAEAATRLYDTSTGQSVATLHGDNLVADFSHQRMSFSPDGALLAVAAADNVVRIWSVAEKKLLFALPHTAESHALTFDPSGAFLIVSYADGSMRVWSTVDGQVVATFAAHRDKVSAIAFSPNVAEFATASDDRDIRLWWNTLDPSSCDPDDRALFCDTHLHSAAVLRGHSDKIRDVIFSPDGEILATIAQDSTLRIWRTRMAGMELLQLPPKAPEKVASCDELAPVADDPQARLRHDACKFSQLMAEFAKKDRRDAQVAMRQANQLRRQVDLPNGSNDPYRIAFADDEKVLLVPAENDANYTLWDLATGRLLCRLQDKNLSANRPDGAVMLHATPFDAASAQCQRQHTAQSDSQNPSDATWAMSPTGTRAVGSIEWLQPVKDSNAPAPEQRVLIDVLNKKAVAELAVDGRIAKTALFSADGTTLIGALAGDAKKKIPDGGQYGVWDAAAGVLLGVTPSNERQLNHVGMASDGRHFVLAQDGGSSITYYFIGGDGQLAWRAMAGASRDLSALAISSDGATVAAAYIDGSIAFFSSRDGKLTGTLPAGIHPVTQLIFSPDASVLAGSDSSRTLWLWDVTSKTPNVVISMRSDPTGLKFSKSGNLLAVRNEDAGVTVLDVKSDYLGLNEPQDIVDWARASLSSTLSATDRQRFLLRQRGNREPDQSLVKLAAAAAPAAVDAPNAIDQRLRLALADGVPGAAQALAAALSGAGGKVADAAFELGLDLDKGGTAGESKELAYFYLQLGERFAAANPDASDDESLRETAFARLRILPRQIPSPKLVALFRAARDWQAP
jgi:WD40 repeat protein